MKERPIDEHIAYTYLDKPIRKLRILARRFTLPGFNSVPFYHVVKFFIRGLNKGSINTRASSISFQIFLASLPAIILFFTLIPFVPIHNFKEGILTVMESILPYGAFITIKDTLEDVFIKRTGVQLFGFLIALFFSTNAITSMIAAFNETYHTEETRTWMKRRLTALFLVIIITALLMLSIGIIIAGRFLLAKLISLGILKAGMAYDLLWLGKWIIFFALIYFTIDFLYFFAPLKSSRLKFFSAGSTFASLLTVVSTMLFDYFIDNFGQFNRLYGSIGTIMVVMMWIYFNALSLLSGYELNASIKNAHLEGLEIPKKQTDNHKDFTISSTP